MKRTLLLVLVMAMFALNKANAQCAMCRATATSNLEDKDPKVTQKKVGAGLNNGILYLMSVPYIIGGVGGVIYWRNRKKIKAYLNGNTQE